MLTALKIPYDTVLFWFVTTQALSTVYVVKRLILAQPNLLPSRLSILLPASCDTLQEFLEHDRNTEKVYLVAWKLRMRDICGTLGFFSGLFMLGAYVLYWASVFDLGEWHVGSLVVLNGLFLILHISWTLAARKACVRIGETALATDIKEGHY